MLTLWRYRKRLCRYRRWLWRYRKWLWRYRTYICIFLIYKDALLTFLLWFACLILIAIFWSLFLYDISLILLDFIVNELSPDLYVKDWSFGDMCISIMSKLGYLRMFGYVATLTMHIGNLVYVGLHLKDDVLEDRRVRMFADTRRRYFTCWTFLVFTVFWTLFLYDRSLIFPDFIDKVLTPASNHIMHTAIVPAALWEVLFRPRYAPKSHMRNISYLAVYMLVYLAIFIYTYVEKGIWLYPIFKKLYGTIYFPLIFLVSFVLLLVFYRIQWTLSYLVWGKEKQKEKKKDKSRKIR